ncbi:MULTISPECIES: TIGR04222 domain-containing membrane protein [unclassified Streptomyces]|uniref:TIGR04222 domain-containing membrane protein n=1 Tax=unclassified Streptomyces TaxID=2593676 RepID=UPI00381F4DCC
MSALPVLVHLAVVISTVALVTGVARSRRRDAPGASARVRDLWEAAFLGGGPGRVAEAAIAGMRADGRLAVGGPGIVAVQRPQAYDPVERSVLLEHAAAPHGGLHTLRLAVMRGRTVQDIGDALAARGLLVPRARIRVWRVWGIAQGLVCVILLPLSFLLASVATFAFPDSPVAGVPAYSVLPTLFVGAFAGFACSNLAGKRITRAGRRALRDFLASTVPSPASLVAAQGPAGVADPVFRAQLREAARMRPGRDFPAPYAASSGAAVVAWCSGAVPGSGTACGGAGAGCGAASCGGGGSGGGSGDGGGGGGSCGGGSSCGGGGGGCGGGGS